MEAGQPIACPDVAANVNGKVRRKIQEIFPVPKRPLIFTMWLTWWPLRSTSRIWFTEPRTMNCPLRSYVANKGKKDVIICFKDVNLHLQSREIVHLEVGGHQTKEPQIPQIHLIPLPPRHPWASSDQHPIKAEDQHPIPRCTVWHFTIFFLTSQFLKRFRFLMILFKL